MSKWSEPIPHDNRGMPRHIQLTDKIRAKMASDGHIIILRAEEFDWEHPDAIESYQTWITN